MRNFFERLKEIAAIIILALLVSTLLDWGHSSPESAYSDVLEIRHLPLSP